MHFIKLTRQNDSSDIFVNAENILTLSYDNDLKCTVICFSHDSYDFVIETPKQILELC